MADKNDRLLSDFDDSDSAGLECDICNIKFQDGQAYENHMQGKKHQKKVTEVKLMAKELAAAKKLGNKDNKEEEEENSDDDDDNEMHCEVCDKYFSGYIPYAAHMKSGLHAKNTKKQKLKKQLEGMPDVLADENKEGDSEGDEFAPKIFARCKMCEKEFSGPENYKKHLNSALHKKKEKQQKALQNLKPDNQDDSKKSDDDDVFGRCHICDKSFSGIVPYQIHMKSNVHKKNVDKKKVAEEMKAFWVDDETEPGYVCNECKKIFSDPLAFKSHLANNSHEKQKAKAALMDFLKAHPEIVFASPLEDSEAKSESEEEDSNYYLICKLCHYSFSGPEAAQDHVKSKKHLNLKKEKKIQKGLREQTKKNDDGKSGDKISRNGTSDVTENPADRKQENSGDRTGDDFEMI